MWKDQQKIVITDSKQWVDICHCLQVEITKIIDAGKSFPNSLKPKKNAFASLNTKAHIYPRMNIYQFQSQNSATIFCGEATRFFFEVMFLWGDFSSLNFVVCSAGDQKLVVDSGRAEVRS